MSAQLLFLPSGQARRLLLFVRQLVVGKLVLVGLVFVFINNFAFSSFLMSRILVLVTAVLLFPVLWLLVLICPLSLAIVVIIAIISSTSSTTATATTPTSTGLILHNLLYFPLRLFVSFLFYVLLMVVLLIISFIMLRLFLMLFFMRLLSLLLLMIHLLGMLALFLRQVFRCTLGFVTPYDWSEVFFVLLLLEMWSFSSAKPFENWFIIVFPFLSLASASTSATLLSLEASFIRLLFPRLLSNGFSCLSSLNYLLLIVRMNDVFEIMVSLLNQVLVCESQIDVGTVLVFSKDGLVAIQILETVDCALLVGNVEEDILFLRVEVNFDVESLDFVSLL